MASINFYLLCLISLCTVLSITSPPNFATQISTMYPFTCSKFITTKCNALLYQQNNLTLGEISAFYSVNISQIRPITHDEKQDYLVSVPCSCEDVDGTTGYFYDTSYKVQPNDTFFNVSNQIYSGQAWNNGEGEQNLIPGENTTMNLLCGCLGAGQSSDEGVVTYTVQEGDTLFGIAKLLFSQVQEIESLNNNLANNSNLLDVGWVLYVPIKNSVNK